MSTAKLTTENQTGSSLHRLRVTDAEEINQAGVKQELARPVTTERRQIKWLYASVVLAFHALLPLMFLPYFFSWYGLLWLPIGNYLFCSLGIGAGYHRLLTHRGFECPRWLEYTLAILGHCCLQDTPARWVAIHRMHHNHSDEQPDPHSPLVTLFWGHMGWLFVDNSEFGKLATFEKYTRDLMRQPFYRWLERGYNQAWVLVGHAALITGLGALYGALCDGGSEAIIHYAALWFFWGVIMRVIYTWHVTWGVNSFAHTFGYRNYETLDNSRNNWVIGLATNGEGWHNNHHADPRTAKHGHQWWELDITYATISLWGKFGLAWKIVQPRRRALNQAEIEQESEAA